MAWVHFILLFGCIIYAAKLGGIGVGMAGGLGMAIAVFGLGLPPGSIPVDVILIIMAVLFTCSVMHVAGGMDYMIRVASHILRSNPKYINILAPAIAFTLTIFSGTGFTTMAILNVVQEVAKQNGVRPSQPLTSAVVASQIAISASPISAATAAMYVVVEKMGVSFGEALCVILPAGLFGAAVASLISSFQGVDLAKDPIFQARMREGLVSMATKEQMEKPLPKGAKLSVGLFLGSVLFIVLMLLFKKEIGHTLGSRDIIVITMLFVSMMMYWFCDVNLSKIKQSSIFHGGFESLIVILGIVWMSSTIIGVYVPTIKEQATVLLGQYPGLLALAFFCVSALLFSQGATSALLVPLAASLGCDAGMILACFVAVSGIFVTNVYPTSAFAVSCDDTGSYMGKWSGSLVINHPFFLPGCLGLVAAIPFGFFMASVVL
ncbi:MAG: anaerobic C4-dicarboxylate transporter [Burkholderiaceae bacterium]|nr:anaerobic C4-dicarboxylate transporter [Burkholderiaceae bacterium]